MKKFTKLINESIESMTWGQLIEQGDIDFINYKPEYLQVDVMRWMNKDELISNYRSRKLTNNITVYDTNQFVLICKNNDPLAIMSVYEPHGCTNFKNIVVMYGHEEIIFYDCDDFTHKKIHTR